MSTNLKSLPEGLQNAKCKKGTTPIRPPILYVSLSDLHKKRKTKQIKVELPNRTKFQMPTYGTGNNEKYLVHVIAILHLVKQKGTAAKVKEAFAAFVAVRKEMSPLLDVPEDETTNKKEARKRNCLISRKPSRSRRTLLLRRPRWLTSCSIASLLARCEPIGTEL
jgi:hypothetical protein